MRRALQYILEEYETWMSEHELQWLQERQSGLVAPIQYRPANLLYQPQYQSRSAEGSGYFMEPLVTGAAHAHTDHGHSRPRIEPQLSFDAATDQFSAYVPPSSRYRNRHLDDPFSLENLDYFHNHTNRTVEKYR